MERISQKRLMNAVREASFPVYRGEDRKPSAPDPAIKPTVRFYTAKDTESIGYWRMGMPYVGVHKLGVYGVLDTSIPTYDALRGQDKKEWANTMVVATHITYRRGEADKVEALVKAGQRVVVDVDDNIWAAKVCTTKDLKAFERSLQLATVVTATTEYLARKIKEHVACNVAVLPNAVSETEFRPMSERMERERLKVLYTGAIKHADEWPLLRGMIQATADFADWFVFMGNGRDKTGHFVQYVHPQELHDAPNIHWQVPQEPMYFLRTCYNLRADVCVAPLAKTPVNRAKSDLKILEAGALGLPVIVQDNIEPYAEYAGMRGETVADFAAHLRTLDTDEEERQRQANIAIDYTWERRVEGAKYLGTLYYAYFVAGS